MIRSTRWAGLMAMVCLTASSVSFAEPYLAVRMGLKCVACHVNPTGGGMRNDFGSTFAQKVLPQFQTKDAPVFPGRVSDMIRLGADLRASFTHSDIPNRPNEHGTEINPFRVYGAVTLIPDRLLFYVDEQLSPGSSQTQEAYVRYGNPADGWYAKGGKFYLPFGWRLEDQSAFARRISGVSMASPDTGLEIGYEKPRWSAQVAVSQGVRNTNADLNSGYQAVAQVVWVASSAMRFGVAGGRTNSDLGDRTMTGVFAALHTGPLVWLAEADYVRDQAFADGKTHPGVAGLAEVNWNLHAGHNLKLTSEFMDQNRDVDGDTQRRWSVVYEFTPLPFVQLRAGFRNYDGISGNDLQNRNFSFLELHGFF